MSKLDKDKDNSHQSKKTFLQILGPLVLLIGGGFTVVGLNSFFSSFGTFGPPSYFWCAFIGLPMSIPLS